MTIDGLIEILHKQKAILGGDAKVVALWDSAVTDLNEYGVSKGTLVFDVEMWGNSEVDFDYMEFETQT